MIKTTSEIALDKILITEIKKKKKKARKSRTWQRIET